jgi:hypothetical protein
MSTTSDRINCREIVMRNLLALWAGVRRTVCWNLAPEIPSYENPLSIMDLMFDKFALLVVWRRADSFTGENEPPVAFELPWPGAHTEALKPLATDALRQEQPLELRDGRLRAQVSVTPLFISAD